MQVYAIPVLVGPQNLQLMRFSMIFYTVRKSGGAEFRQSKAAAGAVAGLVHLDFNTSGLRGKPLTAQAFPSSAWAAVFANPRPVLHGDRLAGLVKDP
jgi:hypothetical protein